MRTNARLHDDLDSFAGLVDLHVPDERGPGLVRKQAAGALGDLGWVEAGFVVRRVQRLTPCMRLLVHRPARRDEGGDIGDRVADAIALSAALEMHGLVEVPRLGRIDGQERDVGVVDVGEAG